MSDIDDIWDDDEDRDQFAVTVVDQRERAVEFATAREEIESLRQQLADSQKQVVTLRSALGLCKSKIAYMLQYGEWYTPELALDIAEEALVATEQK